jgi:hypothetical protein
LAVSGLFLVAAPQAWQDYVVSWVNVPEVAGKPVMAVVVVESSEATKLPKEVVAWINSPTLRKDCRASGLAFYQVDPDVKDRNGNTPTELAAAIKLAKTKGLPRLILVGPKGGVTDFVLPPDETSARKRLGL